jgi:glycine betaine catabolism B
VSAASVEPKSRVIRGVPMSEDFVRVADTSEIPPGSMKVFKLASGEIFIANVDGSFFALPNKCTHVGGPLGRGKLTGSVVQCPWHGSKFDVRTGAVVQGPAARPEIPIQLKTENTSIWAKKQA